MVILLARSVRGDEWHVGNATAAATCATASSAELLPRNIARSSVSTPLATGACVCEIRRGPSTIAGLSPCLPAAVRSPLCRCLWPMQPRHPAPCALYARSRRGGSPTCHSSRPTSRCRCAGAAGPSRPRAHRASSGLPTTRRQMRKLARKQAAGVNHVPGHLSTMSRDITGWQVQWQVRATRRRAAATRQDRPLSVVWSLTPQRDGRQQGRLHRWWAHKPSTYWPYLEISPPATWSGAPK